MKKIVASCLIVLLLPTAAVVLGLSVLAAFILGWLLLSVTFLAVAYNEKS
jgi:uncharacterized membrane protein